MNAVIIVGGRTRNPTPEFEAWWASEHAWYESRFEARARARAPASRPVVVAPQASRPRSRQRRTSKPSSGVSDDDPAPVDSAHSFRLVEPAELRLHPRAALVPEQSVHEYRALKADIAAAGRVTVPLVVLGGLVLDGRHRLKAARDLHLPHVPVIEVELRGRSPSEVILETALHRRQLGDDQRAMMAAKWNAEGAFSAGRGRARDRAALAFNVKPSRLRDAAVLLSAAPASAERVLSGEERLSRALAAHRHKAQLASIAATKPPRGKYRTVVVDPPWHYDMEFGAGVAADQYPTMSDEAIRALLVPQVLADHAHVYLWTTAVKLEAAHATMRAWGFEVKSVLVWEKTKLGLGRYFRSQTEFVLFGTRGRTPLRERGLSNIIRAPAGAHSVKPQAFFDLVERASFGPRLEMFARERRAGWEAWGAEAPDAPAINESAPEGKGRRSGRT